MMRHVWVLAVAVCLGAISTAEAGWQFTRPAWYNDGSSGNYSYAGDVFGNPQATPPGGYAAPFTFYGAPEYAPAFTPSFSPAYTPSISPAFAAPAAGVSYAAPMLNFGTVNSQPAADGTVRIDLRVPAQAKVWFGDKEIAGNGAVRRFVSPPVQPGEAYGYDLRVRWNDGGRTVERTRHVTVHAGDRINLSFGQGQTNAVSTPTQEP